MTSFLSFPQFIFKHYNTPSETLHFYGDRIRQIDLIQILYLTALHGAALSAALPLAGREIAVSIVFVIPIFFLYNALHKRFRFE